MLSCLCEIMHPFSTHSQPSSLLHSPNAITAAVLPSFPPVSLFSLLVHMFVFHSLPILAEDWTLPTNATWYDDLRRALMVCWIGLSHVVGILHVMSRRVEVWEKSALRLRQVRLIRLTKEEYENCERLLANLLPPHVLSSLGTVIRSRLNVGQQLAIDGPAAEGAVVAGTERRSNGRCSCSSGNPSSGVLICESCAFPSAYFEHDTRFGPSNPRSSLPTPCHGG